MDYKSVFDIIGPIMVGPSSSHTAGAARIGKAVYLIFGQVPENAEITFYGSFSQTYKGHGSDVAVVGGLLGFEPYDSRLRDAFKLAEEGRMKVVIKTSEESPDYPNTVMIKAESGGEAPLYVTASSIGGGKIRVLSINGFKTSLSCDSPALLVFHKDRAGTIAEVTDIIAKRGLNIGHMNVSRNKRGEDALMIIEVDQLRENSLIEKLEELQNVTKVKMI